MTRPAGRNGERHILANMQEVMGPLPDARIGCRSEPKVDEESDQGTYIRTQADHRCREGRPAAALLALPKTRTASCRPFVCRIRRAGEFGKGIAAGLGGKPDRHYAVHLAERGYVTLAPDYVNMGSTSSTPTRTATSARP